MEQRPINPGIQPNSPEERSGRAGKGNRAQRANQAQRAHQADRAADAQNTGQGKRSRGAQESDSAAFHVLLEKLQRSAAELSQDSVEVDAPEELADAVGKAKASLNDALSLSDQLLEAWRAERQTTTPTESQADDAGGKQGRGRR